MQGSNIEFINSFGILFNNKIIVKPTGFENYIYLHFIEKIFIEKKRIFKWNLFFIILSCFFGILFYLLIHLKYSFFILILFLIPLISSFLYEKYEYTLLIFLPESKTKYSIKNNQKEEAKEFVKFINRELKLHHS